MRFFLFFLLVAIEGSLYGQVIKVVGNPKQLVNLADGAEYIEDPKGVLSIGQVMDTMTEKKVNTNNKQVIGFGVTPSYFWIKTKITNQTRDRLYLKISSNPLADIQVFETLKDSLQKQYHSGSWLPFHKKELENIDYLFPLAIQNNDTAVVYLRVMHYRGTQFPLHTGTLKAFYNLDVEHGFLDGIYYGFMLLLILYNLSFYLSLKDVSYLFYIVYVFFIALLNASMDGYAFRYFWPSHPALNLYEDVLSALVGISAILFASSFLHTKEKAPVFHKVFKIILVSYFLIIALIVSKRFLVGTIAVEMLTMILIPCIFIAAINVLKKGYRPAKFFIIAWTMLLFSVTVFILKDYQIVPYNGLTVNALQIGSAVEALLLSLALAGRINIYRLEKMDAQQHLIQSLQEKTSMQHEMLVLEAKALRSQMNPHFIFNCMNSIKSLIQQSEEGKAIIYLTTFSKLLRTVLQNADKSEITLYDEIETCRLYLQLESFRFGNKFKFSFEIDENIDLKSIYVPALILQPFIENAIWHGLLPQDDIGYITISVAKSGGTILCKIDDNGIGRERSSKAKASFVIDEHQSKGVKLTQSRLNLDNALNNKNASVTIIDKKDETGDATGTTVLISIEE